ncbi:MAG: glycosyltransferase family 4 protein [Burkholderiales bacterium]|nr:glycosyltransferase family 4 protein [Burkholderiales bacterium]MBK8665217.1 glycosyltransferase family 4 protein [Burkholderiales bacterium]
MLDGPTAWEGVVIVAALDVIVSVDSLVAPLTGIGRYAYELVTRLQQHPEVARLRYFSLCRWRDDPFALLAGDGEGRSEQVRPGGMLEHWRAKLSQSKSAVRVYGTVAPYLEQWQLRHEAEALFHVPNYFVPRFPGATVSTIHDLSHLRYPGFHPQARVDYLKRALTNCLPRTNQIVAVSEFTRREVMEVYAWPADQITTILQGVDESFQPLADEVTAPRLAAYGLSHGAYCLFVGTIEPRKNVDRLLDAYATLPCELRAEWPLVIAGSPGWRSERTHQRLMQAQRDGWLKYLRFVPQTDLPALYAGARLFVYPSIYEGFGLPIAEAMASGVPVITSNTSSMPEVAGDAARLIDPLDVEELRAAIEFGLTNEAWRDAARDAGLGRAICFSWSNCVTQTVDVYRRAMNR